jgi:Subtilase family
MFGLALALALLSAPTIAWSGSGTGGGGDDSSDDDGGESGGDDGGESGGGDDGGESGDGDDGGESGGGDDGGESGGGDDGGETGGGDGGESGSGGEGGESGGDDSGSSENSGRGSSRDDDKHSNRGHGESGHHDRDDGIELVTNDDGDRVRAGEAVLLTKDDDVAQRLSRDGITVIESFHLEAIGSTAVRVAVPGGMTQRQMLDKLRAIDPKGVATFNHVYEPAGSASVLKVSSVASPAPAAAARRTKVGLIDAGVNEKHPLLSRVSVTARAFDARASRAEHGTAVASRIAEVAPGAAVYAANVFTVAADGQEIATADAIARGLDWLAKMRVPVINLSLTGPANPILEAMTSRLSAQGHILVAAVGNEGPRGAPQYPAAYQNVVGVTAVDAKNQVYLYANQGSYVDFAARGVDARVADQNGAVDTVSGTSYAAPVIAAKLARAVDEPDVAQARAALSALAAEARDLGAPGRDPVYGLGLIANQ